MNTPHTPDSVPPIPVPSEEARWLRRHASRNLDAEQPDRFAAAGANNWGRVTDPAFTGATMAWLEESHGHCAGLLDDLDFDL
jgi:hypothetical protein